MSATFIERVLAIGDYGEDGGGIDPAAVHCMLKLYSTTDVDAAYIKTAFALTTAQGAQLDLILGTRPNVLLTIVQGAARAEWATRIYSFLMLGRMGFEDFNTDAKIAAALEID